MSRRESDRHVPALFFPTVACGEGRLAGSSSRSLRKASPAVGGARDSHVLPSAHMLRAWAARLEFNKRVSPAAPPSAFPSETHSLGPVWTCEGMWCCCHPAVRVMMRTLLTSQAPQKGLRHPGEHGPHSENCWSRLQGQGCVCVGGGECVSVRPSVVPTARGPVQGTVPGLYAHPSCCSQDPALSPHKVQKSHPSFPAASETRPLAVRGAVLSVPLPSVLPPPTYQPPTRSWKAPSFSRSPCLSWFPQRRGRCACCGPRYSSAGRPVRA